MSLPLTLLFILLFGLLGGMIYLTFKVYRMLKRFEKDVITEVSTAKLEFDSTLKTIFEPLSSIQNKDKQPIKEAEKWESE